MSGSCAVRGTRFASPCRTRWLISPGPSCSSGPHTSLPGPAVLAPSMNSCRGVVMSHERKLRSLAWRFSLLAPESAVRGAIAGPVTGMIAQVLLLAALAAIVAAKGVGLGAAGWVVGLTCGVVTNGALARGLSTYRSDRL